MLIQKGGAVYMMTNQYHNVLYVGVTSDLQKRVKEHTEKLFPKSFTAKYNCNKLVWYELLPQIEEAILREKQIKGGSRERKEGLIDRTNPNRIDLWETDVKFW